MRKTSELYAISGLETMATYCSIKSIIEWNTVVVCR